MKTGLCVALLALAVAARGDDAIIVGANADRLPSGHGGGVSLLMLHGPLFGGGAFLSLPGSRWAYGTIGTNRALRARITVTAEANAGRGRDAGGGFRYLLLRGGITRELLQRRLYGEAEWLQANIARQQDGILRLGATLLPQRRFTLRASGYRSLAGGDETSLMAVRGDYAVGAVTAIAGLSRGRALPALLQQAGGGATRIAEVFAGASFDVAGRQWTLVATTLSAGGETRRRLALSCRVPWRRGR